MQSLKITPSPLAKKMTMAVVFLFSLGFLHLTLRDFFPTAAGTMGHDWTLAWLLQVQERLRNEGLSLWTIWYSPAACHATVYVGPGFPLNVSAWLVWAGLTPLTAVYLEALIFFVAGFFGMYRLLTRAFGCDYRIALAGAALFMLNQFSVARALIGHQYYPFLLLPWMCALLLPPFSHRLRFRVDAAHGVALAVLTAYCWLIGIMPIVGWTVIAIIAVGAFWVILGGDWRAPVLRAGIAVLVVVPLTAYSLFQQFGADTSTLQAALTNRQAYPLQGFVSLGAAFEFLVLALFVSPPNIQFIYDASILNLAIAQQRHELEFGITFVPLLMLGVGFFAATRGGGVATVRRLLRWPRIAWLALLLAVLALPLLYTVYDPMLNGVFKRLPVFNSTTSPQRIYLLYPVFFLILACSVFSRFAAESLFWPCLVIAVAIAAAFNVSVNRDFYRYQPYQVAPIQSAAKRIQAGARLPPISTIGLLSMPDGTPVHDRPFEANAFLEGIQSMGCYIRGYSSTPIEYLKTLQPGSVWSVRDGLFNIKNPACNAFPKENGCAPGDHFRVEQRDWVERYVSYRTFPVKISNGQTIANWVSWLTWGGILLLAGRALLRRFCGSRVPEADHDAA